MPTQAQRSREARQRTIRFRQRLERTTELCHTFARLSKQSETLNQTERWLERESEWMESVEPQEYDLLETLAMDELRILPPPPDHTPARTPSPLRCGLKSAPADGWVASLANVVHTAQCPACGRTFAHAESRDAHLRGCTALVSDAHVVAIKAAVPVAPLPPPRLLCPICGAWQQVGALNLETRLVHRR